MKPPLLFLKTIIIIVLLVLTLPKDSESLKAKWTPNENDKDNGPLPLSQSQRNQLLQLDHTISQSSDPQKTLEQVATANDMSVKELSDLLERNRKDMEMIQTSGGGGGGTIPRKVLGWVAGSVGLVGKLAKRNPRGFGLGLVGIVSGVYLYLEAPRTGIILSTSPGGLLFSSGHSAFLNPPNSYLSSYYVDSDRFQTLPLSSDKKKNGMLISKYLTEEMNDMELDGVTIQKLSRKSDVSLSITSRTFVNVNDFQEEEEEISDGSVIASRSQKNDGESNSDEDHPPSLEEQTLDTLYRASQSILSSRRFSEYTPSTTDPIRFFTSSSNNKGAALIIPSLGDWNRFGIQPLRVVYEEMEEGRISTVGYGTLGGGHWDGEMRFEVERVDGGDDERGVVVSVSLVIPKKGRKPSKKTTEQILATLSKSISKSIRFQTEQILSLRKQSSSYHNKASKAGAERRRLRFDAQRKQEEMAEDRRRRWQRRNPDGGRWRPSGERMRSPNNC